MKGLYRLLPFLNNRFSSLLQFLPQQCILCTHTLKRQERGLCQPCYNDAAQQESACLSCHIPLETTSFHLCGACQKRVNPTLLMYGCAYEPWVSRSIASMKHQRNFSYIYPLIQLLADRVQDVNQIYSLPPVEAIIYVPMHSKRLKYRGFNQSYIIAKKIGHLLGIPVIENAITKIKQTSPQASLSKKERLNNLKGSFTVNKVVNFQSITVVDDVYTTGTTTREIAKLFPKKHVQIWTLAKVHQQTS